MPIRLCLLFSHQEVIADASTEVKLLSNWVMLSCGVDLTKRILYNQVWNRIFSLQNPLTRAKDKVDHVHWMNISLVEWVFMMLQKTIQGHAVLHFGSAVKHTFTCLLRDVSSVFSTEGTICGTKINKTRKFDPILSQNYRTWWTSRHLVLESLAVVESELLADFWTILWTPFEAS